MKKYNYLIVGSGLFGSVFAHQVIKAGKTCMVIEQRSHIGGNVYCEKIENINVHKYGAHIFHTSNKVVWDYVNSLCEFNRYTNSPIANYKGEIYNLPFNMNTFNKLWGVVTPEEAQSKIKAQCAEIGGSPNNLEEQAISLVGNDVYQKLIKGYTEKQWGRNCRDLPAFIIRRLPVRFNYDNNYFNDSYQGIPIGGYNILIERLLKNCEIQLNTNFHDDRDKYSTLADKIVYTGTIDSFFDYKYGQLEYRSLRFETETVDKDNYQGVAVVNYTDRETAYTRIIEHKHFEFGQQDKTIITKEYPAEWDVGLEPYYPINDEKNHVIYNRYRTEAQSYHNVIFGGRLAEYKYYDMDAVIASALNVVNTELSKL